MRYLAALAVLCLSLMGQSKPMLPDCHMGDKAHPCACMKHTEQAQNEYMSACLLERPPGEKPGESTAACFAGMSTHCEIVEHYGRWTVGPDGEHDNPMPQQCTRACTKSHCSCDPDGERCHFAHSISEDAPAPKGRR
jgi:hypothetical protein